MRKCLSPFFIGREEPGLDSGIGAFDVVLPYNLVRPNPGSKEAINQVNSGIRDFVADTIAGGVKPFVLSGDCLSAIGCLAGLELRGFSPFLLWIDAHGDFHTPETTISGHLGGMPLAIITGRGDLSMMREVALTSLPEERVFLVGGRDLDAGEKEALEASRIRHLKGIGEALERLPGERDLWVHFDTDYVNPNDAPAMRYIATGGDSADVAKRDLAMLGAKRNVLGMSVSAWAPHLDSDGHTARVCWDIISGLAGQ